MQSKTRQLITPAAYAKLRGLNRSTVSRQIHAQQIPTVKGLVDPEFADLARERNLDPAKRSDEAVRKAQRDAAKRAATPAETSRLAGPPATKERPRTREQQEREFCAGAGWMAREACTSARRVWPAFVLEHWPDMSRPEQVRLVGLFCTRLEKWTEVERAMAGGLPEVDWHALFGSDAAAAAGEYEEVSLTWPAAGRIDLACGPDAVPGGAWMEGARACARAICVTARRLLPRLIDEELFEPSVAEDRSSAIHLVAVITAQLEGWLGDYVQVAWLPPIDWDSVFPGGGADAAERYRLLRLEWAG